MRKLIYLIVFSPILTLGQSTQANQIFNFDFEKNQLSVDTVMGFDDLTSGQIIDLSYEWLNDVIKKDTEIYQMQNDFGIRGQVKFGIYNSFSSDQWIDFKITILAKDGKARMIIEDIETLSIRKKHKGSHRKTISRAGSAMKLYFDEAKYLSSDKNAKLQNRIESGFINFLESWTKSINRELTVEYDW
tara:strand:+ start:2585 stop:3148 length:564 start_codon:yes stop_codon:yes gene_type:complete